MIDRYTRPEMAEIFSLDNKYRIWMEIEVLACEAQALLSAEQGESHEAQSINAVGDIAAPGISREEAAWIRAHANIDSAHIDELEATLNHDVIAFLTDLGEHIDADWPPKNVAVDAPKPSRWVHYGMTSSDLGDTALCYQLAKACDLLITALRMLGTSARRRAFEHRHTLAVGRTHGIHAEPMVFGMKFASWAWAIKRAEQRLSEAQRDIAVGAISGAVGSYSGIDPFVENYVCEKLKLQPDPLSTQVVARDRHAQLAAALAVAAATLEQMATEVRALQKTDTLEAEEPFKQGQKGSSAMPHKRNPITAERVCGLARVVKANCQVALDNVALWHERDISHSSAERVALTDSFIALDYMLAKMQEIVDGLVIYPERCLANLNATRGLIYSSKVLLALVDTGLTREAAYTIVQKNAMAVWSDIQAARQGDDLQKRLQDDSDCTLTTNQLTAIFSPESFLRHTEVLFQRLHELSF